MTNGMKYGLTAGIFAVGLGIAMYATRDKGDRPSWGEHKQKLEFLDDRMKKLLKAMQGPHGLGKCRNDDECKVVGLGPKTCEGYNNFLIYSTHDADEPTLLELVREFNQSAEEFNTLSLAPPPCGEKAKQIACVNQDCVPR